MDEVKNNNDVTRQIAFWIGCIGIRTTFVYMAYIASKKYLQIMGIIALIPAIGFFVIYLGGLRNTGIEVAPGGGKIWWSALRPVHGLLYLFFSILALSRLRQYAWIPLVIDVTIGVLAKLFRYNGKNAFS
jgi:uncharacterized membrane protein